jgi:hypothetical protein
MVHSKPSSSHGCNGASFKNFCLPLLNRSDKLMPVAQYFSNWILPNGSAIE